MTAAVAHRGPDGSGFSSVGSVGFGHRRLAIVDLTVAGLQPMETDDHRLRITFNGEIYNHVELRSELQGLGATFRTRTDTEVILEAYRHWGERCIDRFNGMWAFAIHDVAARRVFCSRDRFGEKPFYYAEVPGGVAFGSEIRQLLPLLKAVKADRCTVRDFLFAGIDEPLESTFFEGVRKLPAGHVISIDLGTGEVKLRRAYSIRPQTGLDGLNPESAAAAYGAGLREAVLLRLRADVSVGTCLSGGLDSSSIAVLASSPYERGRGERFRAITAVSEERSNDESSFAELVARSAGLDWMTVKPSFDDFASTIIEVVRAQEEPFGGPSICMQWFVMREASRRGIKVMLDGQGGDETLLGYRRYFAAYMLWLRRQRGTIAMLRALRAFRRGGSQLSIGATLVSMLVQGHSRVAWLKLRQRARWMRTIPGVSEHQRTESAAMRDLSAIQILDLERFSLPALLRFEDKNSMRFGVEARLPFLDRDLVEMALALPGESKFRDGWTKWPLRRCMSGLLPKEVAWRRWKIGFEAPAKTWMHKHQSEMLQSVLQSALVSEFARPGWLVRGYARLHPTIRWRLFSVALWEREFSVS